MNFETILSKIVLRNCHSFLESSSISRQHNRCGQFDSWVIRCWVEVWAAWHSELINENDGFIGMLLRRWWQ